MKQTVDTAQFQNSSLLFRADFDPLMDTLKLYFRAGEIYTYVGVRSDIFDALKEADSAGRYFVANIKGNFDYTKNA